MEVRILNEKYRDAWNSYVDVNPHSIAWQVYEWSDLVHKHFGAKFYPVAVLDQDRIRGILPIYEIKPLKGRKRMISVPHAVAGGILSDSRDVSSLLLDKAIELSVGAGGSPVTLKQYKLKIDGDLKTDDNYYNRELSLSTNSDQTWNRIAEINREMIHRTDKDEISVLYPSKDLNTFYKLLLKHHHSRGLPCVSKKWLKDLIELGMYRVALLKCNGRIAGGTMVKAFKKTISFPFTCIPGSSEEDHLSIYRLYWELIKLNSLKGYEIFHSGRIPKTDDTDPYRLGWGGEQFGYYYQYYPNTVSGTEFSSKHNSKRVLFEKIWKKTPLPVTRLVGPFIIRQFP